MFAKAVFAALKLLVSLEFGVGVGDGSWEMKGELSLHKQWVDFFSFFLINKSLMDLSALMQDAWLRLFKRLHFKTAFITRVKARGDLTNPLTLTLLMVLRLLFIFPKLCPLRFHSITAMLMTRSLQPLNIPSQRTLCTLKSLITLIFPDSGRRASLN